MTHIYTGLYFYYYFYYFKDRFNGERELIGFGLEVIFQFVFLHADSFQFH